MFKNLLKQLKTKSSGKSCFPASCPLEEKTTKVLLKNLSEKALTLYERKSDINKFKKLVISDPENEDYKYLVDKLFDISDNKKFLHDLGL